MVTRPISRAVTSASTRLSCSNARRKIVRGWPCEVDAAPLRAGTARESLARHPPVLVFSKVSLSVCCLTGDVGPRVAAILRSLRPAADEIVVAADSRADRDRLEQYAAAADRVLRVAFKQAERHIALLHAQRSCNWIFRIDPDEGPRPALGKGRPEMTGARRAHQYWVPRRWLYPDPDHWLEETPWWPDYQNRLVRNDGTLRFRGLPHTGAELSLPAAYVEEPIYHLTCLLDDVQARRSRAIRY